MVRGVANFRMPATIYNSGWKAARRRLRDRVLLLGHKSDRVITHYLAPLTGARIKASGEVCAPRACESHALRIVRARPIQQVLDFSGVRETRTLDLGMMRPQRR